MNMFVRTRTADGGGYWFGRKNIDTIEEKYKATYMGHWCTTRPSGGWNESPVDVFYVKNPDTSKGHTNYFGMFIRKGNSGMTEAVDRVMITDASSAFSEPMDGLLTSSGEVHVSRYRHDYIAVEEGMIDGGRDYTRSSLNTGSLVQVTVKDGEFIFFNPAHKEIDPDQRDWEYDGCGNKVHKGTNKSYE